MQGFRCRDLGTVLSNGKKREGGGVLALFGAPNSHQTSWIMVLIIPIDESNLQIQEPTAKVRGRIRPVGTAAVQLGDTCSQSARINGVVLLLVFSRKP